MRDLHENATTLIGLRDINDTPICTQNFALDAIKYPSLRGLVG